MMTYPMQLIAYAENVTIMGNGTTILIKGIKRLDKEAIKLEVEIKENKTKKIEKNRKERSGRKKGKEKK